VTGQPDAYAIWGDWDLEQFKVQVARWRDTPPHPPADVFACVDRWWRRLKQPLEWSGAPRIDREIDPQGNLRWMWVPGAAWLDEQAAYFRVQCFFRVYEDDKPPRLVCDEFRTVRSTPPAEADQAGGMG
jgi:hypothetical protein